MKKCIWCKKDELETTFQSIAHTIPKSIGGSDICENVCDECNHYFGQAHDRVPSIETVIKESFNVSRARFLHVSNEIGKNRSLHHFTSLFFKVNFLKMQIDIKPALKLQHGFLNNLCHQFKRGIYKIYLEESERQNGDGHSECYDFIRSFARYNRGNYPVFYFPRKWPILFQIKDEIKHPKFHFDNVMNYQIKNRYFFEFELFGHLFSIPIHPDSLKFLDQYLIETIELKAQHFYPPIYLQYLTEIDLQLSLFNEKNRQ